MNIEKSMPFCNVLGTFSKKIQNLDLIESFNKKEFL